jgi:hypothetical protein
VTPLKRILYAFAEVFAPEGREGALRRLRMVRVADARPGTSVRVRGRVVEAASQSLTAPFTGRRVVWFRVRYATRVVDAPHRSLSVKPQEETWRSELVAENGVPFFVDDDSGALAYVDARLARVIIGYQPPEQLIEQRVTDVSHIDSTPEAFTSFMHAFGQRTTLYMGSDESRRFYENSFAEGDEIIVAGVARKEAGAPRAAGYRSTSTEQLVLGPSEKLGLILMRPRVLRG